MAKKRVNGEGTIGKRKDGRWEARYIVGRDPETGKQIRKSILGKSQAEVRTKLKEALAEATEIDVVKSGEYNVAGWIQDWYSLYAQPNVRETTARYYKGYIDHHVIPRLGDIPLNKLTSLDIQQFYKDLLENGRIRGLSRTGLRIRSFRISIWEVWWHFRREPCASALIKISSLWKDYQQKRLWSGKMQSMGCVIK